MYKLPRFLPFDVHLSFCYDNTLHLVFQMDHNVIVSDYSAMDRVLKEERTYILNIVKQIKKAGCNVLLVQKSILRDAVSDLAIHFLDKIKVMVVKDIEREDIEFVCKVSILPML